MAGKNTLAAVIIICLMSVSFGVYHVAELLQFEISQFIIFGCKQISSKVMF